MDSKTYIDNALRTESRIDEVKFDTAMLYTLLKTQIYLGAALDAVKKNIFYGKPIDNEVLAGMMHTTMMGAKFCRSMFNNNNVIENGSEDDAKAARESMQDMRQVFASALPDAAASNLNPRLLHAVLGFTTESIEMVEAIYKQLHGDELDRVNMAEEIGDLEWYKAIALDELGADEAVIRERNIAKLRQRFPDRFSAEKAINRDVAAERVILEGEAA